MKKLVLFLVLLISLFVQAKTYTIVKSFTSTQCTNGAEIDIVSNLDELLTITVDTAGEDLSFTVTMYETVDATAVNLTGNVVAFKPFTNLTVDSYGIGKIGMVRIFNNVLTLDNFDEAFSFDNLILGTPRPWFRK